MKEKNFELSAEALAAIKSYAKRETDSVKAYAQGSKEPWLTNVRIPLEEKFKRKTNDFRIGDRWCLTGKYAFSVAAAISADGREAYMILEDAAYGHLAIADSIFKRSFGDTGKLVDDLPGYIRIDINIGECEKARPLPISMKIGVHNSHVTSKGEHVNIGGELSHFYEEAFRILMEPALTKLLENNDKMSFDKGIPILCSDGTVKTQEGDYYASYQSSLTSTFAAYYVPSE